MNNTFRIEVRVLGKWLVSSRNVSAVEADAIRNARPGDQDVRVMREAA